MTNADVLNSWKEIATYVGRGVRTVQRWERELNLPVRRPRGKHRSAVIALKEDIDIWLRTPHSELNRPGRYAHHHENQARLIQNTELLRSRTNLLIARSDNLQKQIARAISIGRALRTSCISARSDRQGWLGQREVLHTRVTRAQELGVALQSS